MNKNSNTDYTEKTPKMKNGLLALILISILIVIAILAIIYASVISDRSPRISITIISLCSIYLTLCWIPFMGIKVIHPKEALALTLFGKYYGTIKEEGMFFVNPFATSIMPKDNIVTTSTSIGESEVKTNYRGLSKRISMKTLTLNNEMQKINDEMGNPILINIVVIWRVIDPTKAVLNVDNYERYLTIQADAALRNIVREYPYDTNTDSDYEKTLRGSSLEVAERIKQELQEKVNIAGIEIQEAKITQLAYAPEIAAAMLQRQQASAVVDARQLIVEGAVGMVEMALEKLSKNNVVELDEERKAAMVSNLLVVLCGNKDAQPIVNTGSLY